MQTFSDLGVSPDLVAALEAMGRTSPFPIQALTIPDALAGRDVCGKAKTGSGKTLAFGLPGARAGRRRPSPAGPVPSSSCPPASCAVQVQRRARAARQGPSAPRSSAIYGGADMEKQIKELQTGVEIVVATPGRMIDLIDRKEVVARRRRRSWSRRGRPHGRHGLPAPGRVDPAPHRRPAPDAAVLGHPRRRGRQR